MTAADSQTYFGAFSKLSTVRTIASGGMGYVELARHTRGGFQRFYAVKRLHPHLLRDEAIRRMFMDEARLAGLLRHPNAVSVLDVVEDDQGPALVMEYIDGVSLSALLNAHHERALLPIQFCVRVAMEAARGLHAAHELRDPDGERLELVHRDVSPQNILIGRDGVARLTDFGVAKALNRLAQTATGTLKGKFGYMSPEVLRYEEPDRRADIFALGVVLFESLSGERLYSNTSGMDGARRILHEPPPDIADYRDAVTPSIVQLLFRMLAKDRDHRPESAAEVAADLEKVHDELIRDEGRLDVGALVDAALAEQPVEPLREASVRSQRSEVEQTALFDDPPRRRWWWTGAAVAIALAAGWWALTEIEGNRGEDKMRGQAPTQTANHTNEGSATPNPAPDPPSPVNDDTGDALETAPVEAAAPRKRSAVRKNANQRSRERRKSKPRRPRRKSDGSDGIPMWKWE